MKALQGLFETISGRLTAGSLLLALVPLLLAALGLGYFATESGRQSLEQRANEQLQSLQTVKAAEVQGYFESQKKLMLTLAAAPEWVKSLREMTAAFNALSADPTVTTPEQRAALAQYFENQFAAEFEKRNAGSKTDMAAQLASTSATTARLQYEFIAKNPAPLGSKNELITPDNDLAGYAALHAALQPYAARIYQEFGVYDFFLVDLDGNVVYTYFKEGDFGTNLKTGPWASSGLGDAYAKAMAMDARDAVYMTDYAPYLPSYNDQAAFLAAPVFDGDTRLGVIIVQLPINQVDAMMSLGRKWQQAGLGESGEIYLVGQDKTPRSVSRFVVENAQAFVADLKSRGVPTAMVDKIAAKGTTIGLLSVDTTATKAALGGSTGVGTYPDYRGVPVLGAYQPLDVLGQKWGMIAEIDAAEAFKPVADLRRQILIFAGVAVLVLGILGVFVARKLTQSIDRPLKHFQGVVQQIAAGDSTARVHSVARDEVGDLARAFDKLLDERVATLEQAAKENEQLNNSVIEIMMSVAQLAQRDLTVRVPVQEDVTGTISDAINMMTSATTGALRQVTLISDSVSKVAEQVRTRSDDALQVAQVSGSEAISASHELSAAASALRAIAQQAAKASSTAETAIKTTNEALTIVRATVDGISASRDQIRETEKRIKRLGERSQEITGVVNIIGQIAERTSVLALNASMQAVAAGEAGRGFAVVADEVKRLAENARQATQQIGSLVSAIQADTLETVQAMNSTITQVVDISRLAERAGGQMQETRSSTEELVSSVRGIVETTESQAKVSDVLIQRARQLIDTNQRTITQLSEQSEATEELVKYAAGLVDTVNVFRLPKA